LRDGPITLIAGPGTAARRFAVWRRPLAASSGSWRLDLVPAHQTLPAAAGGEVIVVQALDAAGREGPRQAFVVNA
jgi:hypothetical protein